ncbi:MAG: UDP-3-O-[3-hydroxymyristoyl] N-acetylglucosamine deacetylase [Candidatus Aminicenantes bacterium]|nr:UDP-3-O-[3-hydroxymyristoyl] N-acetylglucosamine deacetylase [Candidatus Aminicenantes bacterium]NIM84934.1 UDP-3-O-[3-hydroxymyristoyl] N-acetylglucosamine deacetylase [Candidatus Aminicenantes bacterium]NIN24448.1 UDP-3-O-[3-hydroxymyristoyl] N-acetylglucosamine deacetylase [Candidatus Aminicenantes bacterium]NIN48212.1 UDP-3-O-[3-hydroxymyristoyl] N-acetylglucosamine deacetylase [Candidatus Aminicenantes bacterium]NIN91115.1 UDP-3-O-[3-hydroxymyristoyl] N-acetylglucosamine deacetylase [Ca
MEKILIIDDEKNIQVSLASILEDEGYKTFFAASGEEGIEKFRNIRPEAVFLDIWLPGIDGLETLRKILAIDPLQIIIMISGHVNISTAVKAVKEGAYDFLEKPLSLDKVTFVLKRGLEYRKVLAENKRLRAILGENEVETLVVPEKKKAVKEDSSEIEYEITDLVYFKNQQTIKTGNIFYGMGLHSGVKTGLSIKPLSPGKGIRFENISEPGYIPARIEFLDTTAYATSIRKNNLEARTIEHFMATLHAAGITNLSIKINKEVPIGDGSASEFCQFIRQTGIEAQDAVVPEIVIDQALIIGEETANGKFIKIEPADCFSVKYTAIYPEPLGTMSYEFVMDSFEAFEREIASARTYGFMQELSKLSRMGLAEGGRLNNFILIDGGKVINTELRFPEELARHKILDIIGDFYLLGRPIRGKITAQKTGHSENATIINLIKKTYLEG